jgi:hypothetical protein
MSRGRQAWIRASIPILSGHAVYEGQRIFGKNIVGGGMRRGHCINALSRAGMEAAAQ